MATNISSADYAPTPTQPVRPHPEANSSGVSWGAVVGGAFVASAVYLILLALGAGFGLSTVSPWTSAVRPSTVRAIAIIWLIIIEILASAFGGYLTGRLRTKWTLLHTDEVFFRDTANGLLSWAVALIASFAFLASAGAWMTGNAAEGSTFAPTTAVTDPNAYFVDRLFRSDRTDAEIATAPAKAEAHRILADTLRQNRMTAADQDYLARLVAGTTGVSPAEAAARVTDLTNGALAAQDAARKTTAHLLLWMFLSLLLGALSASFAATIGGRQRDHVRAA